MTTPEPMDQLKYKVVELGTSGWCVNDPKLDVGLTKDQAQTRLEFTLKKVSLQTDYELRLINKKKTVKRWQTQIQN